MDVMELRRRIMLNEPHIVTPTSASVQNFKTDVIAPLKECKVHFAPMQEGTGDPSPENVRPITGWTGCKVWRTGKNLIDESYLANGNSFPNSGNYGYYYTDDIQLAPSTRYRFVWYNYDNTALTELGATSINLYVSGASEYIVNNASYRQYSSGFITPATGIIRLGIYHPSSLQRQDVLDAIFNNGKLLLQVGTDDVTYTPYTGTTLPLDWTDSAGTVYGGYVDLVTGEVWKEWHLYRLPRLTTSNCSIGSQYYIKSDAVDLYVYPATDIRQYPSIGATSITYSPMCNRLDFRPKNVWSNVGYPNCWTLNGGQVHFNISNDLLGITDYTQESITTAKAKVINYMNSMYDAENYFEFVYKIRPILLTTLTPTQLKTLRGTNNIWSNANGNIDLKYWTH